MNTERNILKTIIQEFPMLRFEITELFTESTSFIEICEDYVLCLKSIKNLQLMNGKIKQKEIDDLKHELYELKEEILSMIIKK